MMELECWPFRTYYDKNNKANYVDGTSCRICLSFISVIYAH